MKGICFSGVFWILALAGCSWWLATGPAIAFDSSAQGSVAGNEQARRISEFVAAQDWLGPISAVALSPFFGLACLSGIATYGPDWIRNSPLVSAAGPFNSPIFFWIMTALTLMTSLPRWTKFSKPIAMAFETVEAYSAILILIALRFAANAADTSGSATVAATAPPLYEAGILSLPLEILLSIALAINLIVVNTVKLVFDLLVWLMPVPAIDVLLEAIGKAVAACLIGLYAFSPTLATVLNLGILFVCSLFFFAAKRFLVYCREIYLRPILDKVLGRSPTSTEAHCVFLSRKWNGYPLRTRARLIASANGDPTTLIVPHWFTARQFDVQKSGEKPTSGLLSDTLLFTTGHGPVALEARKGIFTSGQPNPLAPIPQET